MNTYKTLIVAGSAILSTVALSNTAFAGEWVSQSLSLNEKSQNEQLFTATSDATAITFTCVKTKLRAAIATQSDEANNITRRFNESRRRKKLSVNFIIDGEVIPTEKWLYNSSSEILATPDRPTSAKLYNAALRQQPVSIQGKHQDKIELAFPPLNEDFSKFGAGCGLGTLKTG